MREIRFTVRGEPVPQGSMKPVPGRGKYEGRTFIIPDNEHELKSWRGRIAEQAVEARRAIGLTSPLAAASVVVKFSSPRLRGHYGATGLLGSAPLEKVTRPDLDKLVRAVFDALKDAFVVRDDSCIVELLARKGFGEPGLEVVVVELPLYSRDVLPILDVVTDGRSTPVEED